MTRIVLIILLAALPMHLDRAIAHDETPGADAPITVIEKLGSKLPPDLVFRDESGHQVRLTDLVHGPTIILPVYYSCTNVCYNLQWNLARSLSRINSKPGVDYRIISISFDERETPRLAASFKRIYLKAMNTPFPEDGWHFLTGDAANIKRFTDAIGYRFQRRGLDFIHPSASVIVSGDGTIVRYLYGATFLPKNLALALIEARNGTSGATIRTMMEYCFTFDPGQNSYAFNLLRVSATVVILCTGGFLAFLIVTGRKHPKRSVEKR